MAITQNQKKAATQVKRRVASDNAHQVRVVAGPGTGKTETILYRIEHLLNNQVPPEEIFVISFTRATCFELKERISEYLSNMQQANAASRINVSTMHSLALRILRRANLLHQYPSDPTIIDEWEIRNVYEEELSKSLNCRRTRSREIRLAHDARWQTLDPQYIAQSQITPAEVRGFNSFHTSRTNLYSCVLPGEIVFRCVEAFQQGTLNQAQLPSIQHLIVDEYQDLNKCDQEFIYYLAQAGAKLFIVGDDDQSIYAFRHANPNGIIQFQQRYPQSSSHILTDCFRCTPAILIGASELISYNPTRLNKNLVSLYQSSTPPVAGTLVVWSFLTAQQEAVAIAESCESLINAGLQGSEDEILILISNRKVQLNAITRELGNRGIPFDPPRGLEFLDDEAIRAVYCLLRIMMAQVRNSPDYPAHRALLALLNGIGPQTVEDLVTLCIANNQNFHDLMYLSKIPSWLTGRASSAVRRISASAQIAASWDPSDTIGIRVNDIAGVLSSQIFTAPNQMSSHIANWTSLAAALPQDMTLEELFTFFIASTEAEQFAVLDQVFARLGLAPTHPITGAQNKVRILTMHGAKGLSGKVVFIPSMEQGIMPSDKSLRVTGLVIESRRLFYVSQTRARAACIVSHANQHAGPPAFALRQQPVVQLPRSQFINEMGIHSVNRTNGLTPAEAGSIISDLNNL